MELRRFISKVTIVTIIGSSFLGFFNSVSAEHITVDKDNPVIEATNNLIIERNPQKKGYTIESSAITEGRATIYKKAANAPKKRPERLDGLETGVHPQYLDGYGSQAIKFNDFKATDTVKVTYNYVGKYKGKDIKAVMTLSNMKKVKGVAVFYEEAAIDFSENLFSGYFFLNMNQLDTKYEFFEAESGNKITLGGDSYFTINSLNTGEYVAYKTTDKNLNSYTTHNTLVNYSANPNYPAETEKVWLGIALGGGNAENDFEDVLGADSFKRATVSFQVAGDNQVLKVGSKNGLAWNSLNSATLFSVQPEKPTKKVVDLSGKDINKVQVKHGQEISYLITQKVNILGQDLLEKYKKFIITDPLPKEVTFLSAELINDKGAVIPNAGTIALDKDTNTLTFTGNEHLLKDVMVYEGESYSLKVNVRVD